MNYANFLKTCILTAYKFPYYRWSYDVHKLHLGHMMGPNGCFVNVFTGSL